MRRPEIRQSFSARITVTICTENSKIYNPITTWIHTAFEAITISAIMFLYSDK